MSESSKVIDLNSDIGEGFGAWSMGEDDELLSIVTSANIACGFHAGDASIMAHTCQVAVAGGVRIGAHIGYRDLAGFGRRAMAVAPHQIRDEALYQIAALSGFARSAGDRVRYVKPHGALYHSASAQESVATAIVTAMTTFDPALALLGPAGSAMQRAATAAGLTFQPEGFADRGYLADGSLAPRGGPGSVLDPDAAVAQALAIATTATATTATSTTAGGTVDVPARSLCVHSDSPGAVQIAHAVRNALQDNGIRLRAFT